MKCLVCKTEFEGDFCPNCGAAAYSDKELSQLKRPVYKLWWFWIIAAVIAAVVLVVFKIIK